MAILAEADREADSEAEREAERRVHIPASAALESPSGEMTQIVGSRDALDETMRLGGSIGEKLETGENSDD